MQDCLQGWIECHPGWAAWVQAIGTLLALLVAVAVPAFQHNADNRRRVSDQQAQTKALRMQITAGLRAEIEAIDRALDTKLQAFETFKQATDPLRILVKEAEVDKLPPNPFRVTDRVIYEAVAANLGVLPTELVSAVVGFYTLVTEIEDNAALSTSFRGLIEITTPAIPRMRMRGEMLRLMLSKFEASGFSDGSNLELARDEIIAAAEKTGYSIEQARANLAAAPQPPGG